MRCNSYQQNNIIYLPAEYSYYRLTDKPKKNCRIIHELKKLNESIVCNNKL